MAEYPCGTCQTEVAITGTILSVLMSGFAQRVLKHNMPFFALTNKDLKNLLSNSFSQKSILKKFDQQTKIHLEKFKELNQVLNKTENNISCDYFEIDEFKKIKFLHLNILSLSSHINELVTFLNLPETKFDIICITESRLSQKNPLTSNINIPGYNIEHTPTEDSAGGALMFISQTLQYKV